MKTSFSELIERGSPPILPLSLRALVRNVLWLLAGSLLLQFGILLASVGVGDWMSHNEFRASAKDFGVIIAALLCIGAGLNLFVYAFRRAWITTGWTNLIFEVTSGIAMFINFILMWHPLFLILGLAALVFGRREYRANMLILCPAGGAIGAQNEATRNGGTNV